MTDASPATATPAAFAPVLIAPWRALPTEADREAAALMAAAAPEEIAEPILPPTLANADPIFPGSACTGAGIFAQADDQVAWIPDRALPITPLVARRFAPT